MANGGARTKIIVTPDMLANWEAALDEGYAYQHVSEMYGVPKALVRKHFPGRGWTPEQIRAHGAAVKHLNAKLAKMERRNKVAKAHDAYRDSELDMLQRRFAGVSTHQEYYV